nr:MAG TPA: hypothetical protein [Bacteriophage sp.]
MPEEYRPNSHKYREEQKELERKRPEKVVRGKVKTKPKSGVNKFTDMIISEDASNVKSYIVMDVLMPAIKKAISDIVVDGINMILYGEPKGRKSSSTRADYVSYRDYSRRDDDRGPRTRSGYSHDDIILESRSEAEEVLTRMDELIDTYGVVSVADLYDLIGKSCEYTDNKYGWTNIRNAEPIRVRDGYMLKLPKALPIK